MKPAEALELLDALICRRSILQHPFYLRWQRGELSRRDLAVYATVYYPHVAGFPEYLRNAIACAGDSPIAATLRQNLHEELTRPAPHPELWLDFAETVGANRKQLKETEPSSTAARTVATFDRLTRTSLCSGLAALYAYESQQPAVSEQKIHGLRHHYGVNDRHGLQYFHVHAQADVEHSRGERDGLGESLARGASFTEIQSATNAALDAYWNLLDAVCFELEPPSTS